MCTFFPVSNGNVGCGVPEFSLSCNTHGEMNNESKNLVIKPEGDRQRGRYMISW